MEFATDITLYTMFALVTAVGAVSFRRAMKEAKEPIKATVQK
jgi:hypothetical protein